MTTSGGRATPAARRACRSSAGVLGLAGSLTCAASMVLVALGVGASAAATSMAAMTGTGAGAPHGLLGALVRAGPWLLAVSALLVSAAFTLSRRPVAALPALLAGAVLYTGMYAQSSFPVMYLAIAVGYATWITLSVWVRRTDRRREPATAPNTPNRRS